jgi:hypothetical protein
MCLDSLNDDLSNSAFVVRKIDARMYRNLENLLNDQREIKLTKVDALKKNQKLVVMKRQAGFGEGIGSKIVITESAPIVTVLKADP